MPLQLKKVASAPSPLPGQVPPDKGSAGEPSGPRTAASARGRQVLAVLVVLFLVSLSLAWFNNPLAPGNGKAPASEKGWNLFWVIQGNQTFSGQDIEIYGDVIVEKGADLRFVDCNLTVNGTFQVLGNLSLDRSRIGPYPAVPYYYYRGKAPEPLSVMFDLSGRSRAALRFDTRHYLPAGEMVSVNVFSEGGWHNGQLVLKGAPHRMTNHTLDLSRFCGGPVKVEFAPVQQPNGSRDFQLSGLKVETDLGPLPAGAVDIVVPGDSWYLNTNGPTYRFRAQAGSVLLAGSEVREASYVMNGRDSKIAVRATTVRGAAATSFDGQGHGYFVVVEGSSVELSDCTVSAMGVVQANNSIVSIERTRGSFGSTVVSARNTDLLVRDCGFGNCTTGVYALVDRALGRGSLDMRYTNISDCTYGVRMANQTGAVLGCDISARYPFSLSPPHWMDRRNCTAMAILSLDDSRIRVNATSAAGGYFGVQAFSAIPILDVYDWFLSNSWDATSLYKRTAAVSYQNRNEERWPWGSVVLNARGTAETLGPGFEPQGTCEQLIDPMQLYQDFPSWDGWGWENPLDRRAVDLETIIKAGEVIFHNRTDEARLNFSLTTEDGMAFLDRDLGELRSPVDVLILDFKLNPICDISIRSLGIRADPGTERLVLSVSCSINGLRHDYYAATSILLGGRQLVYDIESIGAYELDAMQVKDGGNLTVKVFPLGVTDIDLSDNVASVAVRAFNMSCELSGPQDMEGFWVLKPGVDLSLNGCTLDAAGKDAAIVGMGRNRLSVVGSTLACDGLLVNVSEARLEDTEMLARGGARLELSVGSLAMDNVTLNSRWQDLAEKTETARGELEADPGLLEGTDHWYSADWQCLRPSLTVEASSCIINGSGFVDCQRFTIVASAFCGLYGNSLVLGYRADLSAPELLVARNVWEGLSSMHVSGQNISLLENRFHDLQYGLTVSGNAVRFEAQKNIFSRAIFNESPSAGLYVSRADRTDVRNNTFSGCVNAVCLYSSDEPRDMYRNNTFQGVQNASVARWKRLTYEMYPSALGTDFMSAPYISDLTVAWADLFVNRTDDASGWTSYGGGERHMRAWMEFIDSLVDASGVARSLEHLDLRITASYSDGKERVFDREVEIPEGYQWTERLE